MKNWPACSPNPPATENKKRIQESWAARILYQRASLSQKCDSWSPKLPEVYGLLLKEQWMIHSGKDVPVPAFLGACCWAIIFLNMVRFSHFKHLMCFAYAIVNRIWGCEISIRFTFIHIGPKNTSVASKQFANHGIRLIFTFNTSSQLFGNWGCKLKHSNTFKNTHTQTHTLSVVSGNFCLCLFFPLLFIYIRSVQCFPSTAPRNLWAGMKLCAQFLCPQCISAQYMKLYYVLM